jgi:hypothetical protein
LARAPINGNEIVIGDKFFEPGGATREAVILHEGGHSAGLVDVPLPGSAPPGVGRLGDGVRRAYGEAATNWLGANMSKAARRNSDSYTCYAEGYGCGGP